MQFFSERAVKARKTYVCGCCVKFIFEGESYTRGYGFFYGADEPCDMKVCSNCHTPATQRHIPPAEGPDPYEYVKRVYAVPVTVGQRITVDRKEGIVVVPQRSDQYVHVRFSDNGEGNCHPTWETVYYAEDGVTVLADYRAKKQAVTA